MKYLYVVVVVLVFYNIGLKFGCNLAHNLQIK